MEFLVWPAVVLVLVLVFMLVFKQPITRFIDRAQKVSRQGIEAAASPAAQEASTAAKPSPADELLKSFDNALLVNQENFIRSELEKLKIAQGPDPSVSWYASSPVPR